MADTALSLFCQLTKVDEKQRLVYGRATAERPDQVREIMDYASSRPNFEKWSGAAYKRSGGKSKGNVREMHEPKAAGKVVEISFNDTEKAVDIGTYCADDGTWQKVLDGVLTGFSIGGTAKRYPDPKNPSFIRYTAYPTEISYVDSPMLEEATFSLIKADGTTELRKLSQITPGLPADLNPNPGELAQDDRVEAPAVKPIEAAENDEAVKAVPDAGGFKSPNLTDTDRAVQSPAVPRDDPMEKLDAPQWTMDFVQAVRDLVAFKKAADSEKAAKEKKLEAIGARVGIRRKDGEPIDYPKGYPTSDNDYGDPANRSWPYDTAERVRSALSYFNGGRGLEQYSPTERNILGRRIATRASSLLGGKYSFDKAEKKITSEDKKMAESTTLQKDVGQLLTQINQAVNVAADQIGDDPRGALMQLIASLKDATDVDSASMSASPEAPTGSQAGADTTTIKSAAVTPGATGATSQPPTGTTGTTDKATTVTVPSSSSSSSDSSSSPSDPSQSPAFKDAVAKMDAANAKVDAMAEAMTKFLEKLSAPGATPTEPVNKGDAIGDLAALVGATTPKDDPVIAALLSGERNALYKAAVLAGTENAPDMNAVVNRALAKAEDNLALQFSMLMATRDPSYFTPPGGESIN